MKKNMFPQVFLTLYEETGKFSCYFYIGWGNGKIFLLFLTFFQIKEYYKLHKLKAKKNAPIVFIFVSTREYELKAKKNAPIVFIFVSTREYELKAKKNAPIVFIFVCIY